MRRFVSTVLPVLLVCAFINTQRARAQTFSVLHTFTGQMGDGASPYAGVTLDGAGNLYGTTGFGGGYYNCGIDFGCGSVFRLTHRDSAWILRPLYSFAPIPGDNDGAFPQGRVIFGPDGSLYGTTTYGGGGACSEFANGCGTVFNLKPSATACKTAVCQWTETVLYRFAGGTDGSFPQGDLVFDHAGNVYGTAGGGGLGDGVVYKLASSNGDWTESILYRFTGGRDGGLPVGGVIFDKSGNLFGATESGGAYGYGAVYKLTPVGSGWIETVLYSFSGGADGFSPFAGLIFDSSGDIYGTTALGGGGSDHGGTVFMLSPSNGNWAYTLIYSFKGGGGPEGSLAMDAADNLYGTTYQDGAYESGSAFKLTPENGGWTYTSLHDFTGGADGGEPVSNLILDANGNLYGTTWWVE
jgi:uncharacterized repeat protein (TIGR03803 family)